MVGRRCATGRDGVLRPARQHKYPAVRLGAPQYVNGLMDVVRNPIYATGVGLLLYGYENIVQRSQRGMPISGSVGDLWSQMKSWFQGQFWLNRSDNKGVIKFTRWGSYFSVGSVFYTYYRSSKQFEMRVSDYIYVADIWCNFRRYDILRRSSILNNYRKLLIFCGAYATGTSVMMLVLLRILNCLDCQYLVIGGAAVTCLAATSDYQSTPRIL